MPAPKTAEQKARRREYMKVWKAANPNYQREWHAANPTYQIDRYAADPEKYRVANRARHAANPEHRRGLYRDWYVINADKCKAYVKDWREENQDKARAMVLAWQKENPEKQKAASRAWAKANPDMAKAQGQRRRVRLFGAPGRHTGEDIIKIRLQQNDCCAALHCRVKLKGKGTLDHIIALARGGSNWPSNLQLLCKSCNSSKGARSMRVWLKSKETQQCLKR